MYQMTEICDNGKEKTHVDIRDKRLNTVVLGV